MEAKNLLCTDIGIFLHSDLVFEFQTFPWESAFVQWSTHFWFSDQLRTRTYIHVCCLPPMYLRPEYFTEVSSKGKLSPLKCLSENKFVLLKKRYSKSCTVQVINPSSIQFNAFKLANPIPRSVLFPIPSQRPSTSSEVSAIKDPSESENAHNAAGS